MFGHAQHELDKRKAAVDLRHSCTHLCNNIHLLSRRTLVMRSRFTWSNGLEWTPQLDLRTNPMLSTLWIGRSSLQQGDEKPYKPSTPNS
jgi:hypothetical protein